MTRKVALAVLFVAFAAAGCSQAGPDSQAPQVSTSLDSSAAPSESPAAQSSPTKGASTAPSKKADTGPTYPTTAKAYGSTLLTAWGAKNSGRVDQLASNAAILQLGMAQSQDKQWTYISCDASGDSTACLYRNSYGDQVTATMTTAAVGQPTAVTDILLNRTSYASSRTAYAGALIEAWQSGNVQRMTRLANSTVANYLKGKPPLENFTASDDGTKVRVDPASAGGGISVVLTFDSSKLGAAHAVTAAATD